MSNLPEQPVNMPIPDEVLSGVPTPQESAEALNTVNLIERFNTLEGPELEQAVTTHLQGVVDESLIAGADKETVDAKLRTEWLKFAFSGIGLEGEIRTQPTFLSRVDYVGVQLGVVASNQERIDQSESKVTTTAETVKKNMFSYQDVLSSAAEKEDALKYTLESAAADKYAREMARELLANGSERIDKVRSSIKWDFEQMTELLPDTIKSELSLFASSDSWINWDIAKQKYLSSHPPQSNAEYEDRSAYIGMGIEQDPLETEAGKFSSSARYVQRSIAQRHIGWEIQQMAQRGADMRWLTSQNQAAAEILHGSTKEDGQIHSWQYVELGRVTQDVAEYLSHHAATNL